MAMETQYDDVFQGMYNSTSPEGLGWILPKDTYTSICIRPCLFC